MAAERAERVRASGGSGEEGVEGGGHGGGEVVAARVSGGGGGNGGGEGERRTLEEVERVRSPVTGTNCRSVTNEATCDRPNVLGRHR
uniref:Expressed protein n=2 Tax=Oryza sativa subsp. japonica TaxID=39947 RepID=Q53JZ6_ORYSJ|nr:hypothetical protein LOC_Os11g47060 [Oryza sativa Japonica Group]ABA95449.1 expressed protein [Oryza sativa Japonica Group]